MTDTIHTPPPPETSSDQLITTGSDYPLILNFEQLPRNFQEYVDKISRPPPSLKEKVTQYLDKSRLVNLFNSVFEITNRDIYSILLVCVMLYLASFFIGTQVTLALCGMLILLMILYVQPFRNREKILHIVVSILLVITIILLVDRIR